MKLPENPFNVKPARWCYISVILGFLMILVIRDLENTGYKMSWLVMSSWRCCVSIILLTHLPLSTAALCCLFSWVLCKCVVTLFPVRNHWLMYKFRSRMFFFLVCYGDWTWTVGCDMRADVHWVGLMNGWWPPTYLCWNQNFSWDSLKHGNLDGEMLNFLTCGTLSS